MLLELYILFAKTGDCLERCWHHKPETAINKPVIFQPKGNFNKNKLSYFEPIRQVEARLVCPSQIGIFSSNEHIQCREVVGLGDLTYTSRRLQPCLHLCPLQWRLAQDKAIARQSSEWTQI